MSAAHTQGLLVVRGGFSLYAEDGKTPVADACLNASLATHDEGNAHRLAACWNAFDGMEIDSIEELAGFGYGVARLIVHADDVRKERDTLATDRDLLLLERDMLRAALSKSLSCLERSEKHTTVGEWNAILNEGYAALGEAVVAPAPAAVLPTEAVAIGRALDCASLEQGEPA